MYKQLNYIWRIIATGICFALFGLGGLFLSFLILPLQKIMVRDDAHQKRTARKTVHYMFKFFLKIMSFLGIFKFNFEQAHKLKELNGHLILANHPSLIDVVVLISIIPNADCVVKTHLFKNFFLRGVVKNTGYISNSEPEGLLSDCERSLNNGNNLIIFPEGTRTAPGEVQHFQRGAANIAVRSKIKITTVLLRVLPSTLTKLEPWYRVPDKKAEFTAKIIDSSPQIPQNNAVQTSKVVREFNRKLENFFKEELSKNG